MRFTRGVSGSWTAAGSTLFEEADGAAAARPRNVRVSRTWLGLELVGSAPRVLSFMMRDRRLGVLVVLGVMLFWLLSLPRGVRPAWVAALLVMRPLCASTTKLELILG